MNTTSGIIVEIYEVSTPTSTIVKQRFLLRTEEMQNLFMTLFNNIELLKDYKVGDKVQITYNSKTKEVGEQVYTDHFVCQISRLKSIDVRPLEYFETGKHSPEEYFLGLRNWIESRHNTNLTAIDAGLTATEFIVNQKLSIKLFHWHLEEVVSKTPSDIQIVRQLLLSEIQRRIALKYDF